MLWECLAEGKFKDGDGLKGGCTRLTTIRQVELPQVTNTQRERMIALCFESATRGFFWRMFHPGVSEFLTSARSWTTGLWPYDVASFIEMCAIRRKIDLVSLARQAVSSAD